MSNKPVTTQLEADAQHEAGNTTKTKGHTGNYDASEVKAPLRPRRGQATVHLAIWSRKKKGRENQLNRPTRSARIVGTLFEGGGERQALLGPQSSRNTKETSQDVRRPLSRRGQDSHGQLVSSLP